jgi:glyoxylase-like metal-dependent hydrolase (beta-lactamase superfamily II)
LAAAVNSLAAAANTVGAAVSYPLAIVTKSREFKMNSLITVSAIAVAAITGFAPASMARPDHNPANTISLEVDHPDSFRHFASELPEMRAHAAGINTNFGLHVSEIEPGLFFVTDLVYQSAFIVTDDGVVVLDAPPSFGQNLRAVIEMTAPDMSITHLIMSHGHRDHNGGGYNFGDIDGFEVVTTAKVAKTLKDFPLEGILAPTQVFDAALDMTIDGVKIEPKTAKFHAEDTDVTIFLPKEKFLMAIDTITPGEAPFMNFGTTSDINAYFGIFEILLAYDFDHFLSGHVSVLGNRQDVIIARDYAFDVRVQSLG